MIYDYETARLVTIIQSYFSETISIYKNDRFYCISIDNIKTNVKLTSNYKDVVMQLYIESRKVDPRAMDTIQSLME